jgi:formylglycine-generating enzyme required for sulfatase activity
LLADNKVVLDRKAVKSLAPHLAKFEGDRTALISETVIELEKSRILRRSDDSFELAHDSLAALIDEQRSVEQRHLRDIRRRIETGYREHVDSGGAYFFDKGQLGRIEPFLSKLVLEPEQAEFLEKSQIEAARIDNVEKERAARELKLVEGKLLVEEQARKRQRYFTRLVAGVAIVALIAAVVAFIQQQRAKEALVKVEKGIIRDANNEIYHLRYGEAYEKLKSAAQIGQNKGETAHALLEVAFYYDESGHADKAKGPLDLAAALLGKPLNQGGVAALDPAYYGDLRKRYYPDMVEVKGGDTKIDGKAALISTFKIARTETTFFQFGLYTASVGLDIQQFSPVWGLDGDNPVVNVTWYHAARYANWLSKKTGMTKDTVYVFSEGIKDVKGNESIKKTNAKNYRLPSDIEWEYAARGGIKYDTSSYSGSADLASVAWFEKNSDSLKVKRTRQVNTRKANGLGLSDMTGNVWEWCDDWYEDYPAVFPADYRGAVKGEKRVFRGGGYTSDKEFCLISFRNAKEPQPSHPNYDLGFRLALQL